MEEPSRPKFQAAPSSPSVLGGPPQIACVGLPPCPLPSWDLVTWPPTIRPRRPSTRTRIGTGVANSCRARPLLHALCGCEQCCWQRRSVGYVSSQTLQLSRSFPARPGLLVVVQVPGYASVISIGAGRSPAKFRSRAAGGACRRVRRRGGRLCHPGPDGF